LTTNKKFLRKTLTVGDSSSKKNCDYGNNNKNNKINKIKIMMMMMMMMIILLLLLIIA